MSIITLTSDLGTKDYYLAAVKAAAYKAIHDVQLIDITHYIPPFNIAKAAYVLGNVWREFPVGTIHIIGVDSNWTKATPYVIVEKEGHRFIGNDNGFFSLLFDREPADSVYAVRLTGDESLVFPMKDIFVPLAGKLVAGARAADLGESRDGYKVRSSLNPVVSHDNIRGSVVYIDIYGNVITNITRELFEKEVGSRPFSIVVRRGDFDLKQISRSYGEVPEGEKVALFTSSGYLEIAINRGVEGAGGGAADLLGIREDDIIRIEIDD